MSFWDHVLDIALVALVLRQIRGKTLTVTSLLWPVGLVLVASFEYLEVVPTGETDLDLIVAGVIAGLLLGVLCALHTLVLRRPDGSIFAKATTTAAIFWVFGIGARLGFAVYASTAERARSRGSARRMLLTGMPGRQACCSWR